MIMRVLMVMMKKMTKNKQIPTFKSNFSHNRIIFEEVKKRATKSG